MLILGLTGGIASGKSTVSKRLSEEYDLPIIDADKIAREIVYPGKTAYKNIVAYFGPKIPDLVNEDKSLNRPALGRYVFANKDELKVLNEYTHPEVRKEMAKQVLLCYIRFYKVCVLDVPLLYEANLDLFCGKSICVVCERETQLERLRKRNPELSKEECENRIKNQMDNEHRVQRADIVLWNDSTLDHLYTELDNDLSKVVPNGVWSAIEVLCPPLALISAFWTYYCNSQKLRKLKETEKKPQDVPERPHAS